MPITIGKFVKKDNDTIHIDDHNNTFILRGGKVNTTISYNYDHRFEMLDKIVSLGLVFGYKYIAFEF